jgi:uncharacterized protein with FMN-binding domain
MRRAFAAVALTVIGLWLVLSFKSSPVSQVSHVATPATTAPATTAPARPGDTGQEPAAGPPPGSGSSTTQPAPSSQRTINGDAVPTRYGDVQVAVVLNGGQIVDVKALQLPFDRARSQAISDQVAPMLHDEVVQAQGAQIDTIGGATYTSDGYAQSLQSALDKAHG